MKTFHAIAALAAATTAFAAPSVEKRATLPPITVKGNGMCYPWPREMQVALF